MTEMEFDKYAQDYEALHQQSIAFSGCETVYFADYKIAHAAEMFQRYCTADDRLLDFGCGTGTSIPSFNKYLPAVIPLCADVSVQSLDMARQRFGGKATYLPIEGNRLALASGSVGMSFTACVFHHIPPALHGLWITELYRVTRPGGILLVFEHNPFNPLTRHAVASCAFDRDAILLRAATLARRLAAGGWEIKRTRYHVFFPGFLKLLRPLERGLGWLPMGGQYSVLAIRK